MEWLVHSGPAPSHASDSQSGSHQTLPVLRRRHSVPMPPLRKPSVLPGTESWLPPISLQHIFEVVLLVAFFVSGLTSIFALRKRGRMTSSGMGQDDKAMNQEKKPGIHQRKDSYQEEDLHPSSGKMEGLGATLEEKSSTERQNDVVVHRPSLDQEPNQYLQSLRQETLQPILSPIYPWIAPPQDLPGPYDAPYYPPPLPTIKTEESLQNDNQPGTTKTEPPSDDVPEELETITYTRRISTTSTSDQESLVEGTVTVSTKGWRRTQWSVTAG